VIPNGPEFPDTCPEWLPQGFYDTLRLYVEHRARPGSFMTAVLSNNLREAVGHGDDASLAKIRPLIQFIHCRLPGDCWGTPAKVKAWLQGGA
jgi:hypothetical protein